MARLGGNVIFTQTSQRYTSWGMNALHLHLQFNLPHTNSLLNNVTTFVTVRENSHVRLKSGLPERVRGAWCSKDIKVKDKGGGVGWGGGSCR
jgi:hypothetical protein